MKKRQAVFRGELISVFRGLKTLPDKRQAYMEEVEHPGAALMVPMKCGKVVFIRQYRPVIGKAIWELPAGIFSRGESPAECAMRELEEETGYVPGALAKIGEIYTSPGFCNEKIYVFKAECVSRKPAKRDEHELISVRTFSPEQVKSMLARGKITDAKTISALALAGIV